MCLILPKQHYHEQGERAGKLLTYKVKQFRAQNVITILSTKNQLITGN